MTVSITCFATTLFSLISISLPYGAMTRRAAAEVASLPSGGPLDRLPSGGPLESLESTTSGSSTLATTSSYLDTGATSAPATAECRTAADVVNALMARVRVARVLTDILLLDSDWAPYTVPVLLLHNFTVTGVYDNPANWSVVDLGLVRNKVILGPGVQVNFTRLVLKGFRKIPSFQAPGFELFMSVSGPVAGLTPNSSSQRAAVVAAQPAAPTSSPSAPATTPPAAAVSGGLGSATADPAGEVGRNSSTRRDDPSAYVAAAGMLPVGWIDHAAVVHGWCLPPTETRTSVATMPRPASIPGKQQAEPRIPQPSDSCVNDSSRWDLHRCWPSVGLYVDLAVYGYDMDEMSGYPRSSGYVFRVTNTYFLCMAEMSEECVQRYSMIGCFKTLAQAPGGANNTGGESGAHGGGIHPRRKVLKIVLPSVLIGSSIVGLVCVAAIFWALRRQRRCNGLDSPVPARAAPEVRVGKLQGGAAVDEEAAPGVCGGVGRRGGGNGGGGGGGAHNRCGGGDDGIPGGVGAVETSHASFQLRTDDDDRVGFPPALTAGDKNCMAWPHSAIDPVPPKHLEAAEGALGGCPPPPLRCTSDEVALLPVTSVTPLLAAVTFGVRVRVNERAEPPRRSEAEGPIAAAAANDCSSGNAASGVGSSAASSSVLRSGGSDVLEVQLLPNQSLGAGSFGRVVVGVYRGERVAVKLLNSGLVVRKQPGAPEVKASWLSPSCADVKEGQAADSKSPLAAGHALRGGGDDEGGTAAAADVAAGAAAAAAAAVAAAVGHGGQARGSGGNASSGDGGLGGPLGGGGGGGGAVDSEAMSGGDSASGGAVNTSARPYDSTPREVLALAREVDVLARCQHPNIVRLLAANLQPSRVCLVMELMDTSLESLVYGKYGGGLPLTLVVHIGMQIARALSYLHPTILHRDLKPANVLISQPDSDRPVAKLADFGLSRLLNTVLVTRNPEVGTAPYMAPETFDTMNSTITDRVDIFSLGVILWEMLAGRRPWEGRNMFQIAYAVTIKGQNLPLDSVPPERCPPKLRALIRSCWEVDPLRRPAAAEVAKTLALVHEAGGAAGLMLRGARRECGGGMLQQMAAAVDEVEGRCPAAANCGQQPRLAAGGESAAAAVPAGELLQGGSCDRQLSVPPRSLSACLAADPQASD